MFAKRFLVVSLSCFIVMVISYAWIVDKIVFMERSFPYSYRQFLLESSAQIKGKVIVESGSNSLYGIEPFELSRFFNAPVLTIANNAGYPLQPKIFNIEKFVQKGDIVLLPLEWNQYASPETLPEDFIASLAGKDLRYEFYFNNLPFWEKLTFIFTKYPLLQVLRGLVKRQSKKEMMQADLKRLPYFRTLLNANKNESYGNSDENIPGKPADNSGYVSCDEYLFYKGFIISEVFKENLLLLKNLVRKGASVYFMWPSVVDKKGSHCYQDPRVDRYANEIKSLVETEGFQFIGDYQQSRSPSSCFLNTYYHIIHDCAVIRSRALIKAFQALHIETKNSSNTQSDFIKASNRYLNEATLDLQDKLSYRHFVDSIGNINLSREVSFISGWNGLEDWGIWSSGNESVLNFKISAQLSAKNWKLRVRGAYYDGSEFSQTKKTRVDINGVPFGEHTLIDKTFTIPAKLILDEQVNIRLSYATDTDRKEQKNMQFGLVTLDIE